MPNFFGNHPNEDLLWATTLEAGRRRAEAAAAAWTRSQAAYAAHIAKAAPWLPPGVVLGLAKGNASPSAVAAAARAGAALHAQRGAGRPGELVRGAQMNPGDRRLFGREREQEYFGAIAEMEPEVQRARREEAFLGREPGQMRTGVSEADDLLRSGLINAKGQLVAPLNAGAYTTDSKFDPQRLAEVAPDQVDQVNRFMELLRKAGRSGQPVEFIEPDGEVGVYEPQDGSIYPRQAGVDTVNPFPIASAFPEIGEYMRSHRLITGADVPGLEQVGPGPVQKAGTPSITESLQAYFMAGNAPVQEFTGQIRNIYGAATGRSVDWWEPQSDFGISLGGNYEPGDGIFVDPDESLAQERMRREAERGQIYGQNITLGRIAAGGLARAGVIEPGDDAYRILSGIVDGAVQVVDPTVLAAGGVSRALAQRTLFAGGEEVVEATPKALAVAAGLAEATRVTGIPQILERAGVIKGTFIRGVHGPTRDAWLIGQEGSKVVDAIAESTSGPEIWRMTGNKLTRPEVRALRDATTPDQVRQVLKPMLGESIRTTDDVWRTGFYEQFRIVQAMRDTRALADVPGSSIDLDDPQSALHETEAWLRNAHVPDEVVDYFLEETINADSYNDVFDVVTRVMNHTDGVLAQGGAPAHVRTRLTNAYMREAAEAQKWFLSEGTEQLSLLDEITVGDKVQSTGGPFLWSNHYNRFIYLPDFREVRRLTSQYPNIAWTAEGKLRKPAAWVMAAQEDVWKPFTLLRGAWPVRVIAEEQFRMAAAGMSSMFRDPLSFVAFAIARRRDVGGDLFEIAREYQKGMIQRSAGWLNERPGRVRTGQQVAYAKTDEAYTPALGETIVDLHNDPVARRVAQSASLDEAERWATQDPEGIKEFDKLRAQQPEYFADSRGVRRYLENANFWVDEMTGGNTDLLDAIRTGELKVPSRVPGKATKTIKITNPDRMTVSQPFLRRLGSTYADAGPEQVLGATDAVNAAKVQRGAIVERMFGFLMARPSNYLSRSPVWRQSYWQRVEELITHSSPETKEAILAHARQAEEAGWGPFKIKIKEAPHDAIRRMERIEPKGKLTLGEVDGYAKGYALDETRELLYDLTKRGQLADSARLVAPFGEAWKEVVTRWATLANPLSARGTQNLRRFSQIMNGARGEDLGEVLGAPEGEGFFWFNEFGEEVFIAPGSEWLTGLVTDALGEKVPVPMTARVRGLSMFGDVIPGIGPAASIPVSFFLPDKPGWRRNAREILLPYGSIMDEQGESAITQVINYAPPWMRRGIQALSGGGYDMETNRLYANSVMAAANYLYSTGEYNTSTVDGQQKLLAAARSAARTLYGVRAFVAFGAPSAPSFDWVVETDKGTLRFAFLREEYYRLIKKEGFEAADEIFLDRFGPGAGMTMQAMTRAVTGGVEPTEAFGDWAAVNGDLRHRLPATWGFFGPQGGKFDPDVYARQIYAGDREALTPDQWLALGQNHLGQMLRDRLIAKLGPETDWTDADRDFKRDIEARIANEYPGFGDFMGLDQRADFKDNILPELAEAVKDEQVLATEAGQGLALYWKARQKVLEYATTEANNGRGYAGIDRAQELAPDREWLYMTGQRIATQYPDFATLWDRHLRHEVEPEVEG